MYRKNSFFVVSFVFRLFFSHVFLFEENKYSLFLLFQKLLIIVVSTQKHNFEIKRKHCSYGKILAGIAGMIFLSGCSKMETQSEGLPIRISASLNVYTRATDNSFEQGDALGLYLVKWTSGTPGILQGTGNYGDNLSFSLTSSGWQTSTTAQYPQDGEKLDFYAYHPYVSSSALDGEGYRVHRAATDQRQESAYKGSDLLMASASGVSAGTAAYTFSFRTCSPRWRSS